MSNLIYIKIDVTKIDKARLFQGKNGAKYLDLVCVPTTNSKYGDSHFITQSATKEERANGLKLPIIGNAKEQEPRANRNETETKTFMNDTPKHATPPAERDPFSEDVPF